MELKTKVKVGEINNLSDARYCAGMGVDMIGFSFEESSAKYLSPAKIAEIANWLTGIKIVGEFDSMEFKLVKALSLALPLDYIQLDIQNFNPAYLTEVNIPFILKVKIDGNLTSLQDYLKSYEKHTSYFLLESDSEEINDAATLIELCREFKILLGFGVSKENMSYILTTIKPYGIALKGGVEIRPGLKDFEDLSEILEILEVDDLS